jgi:DNA-binding MarR family transcriptional regulator
MLRCQQFSGKVPSMDDEERVAAWVNLGQAAHVVQAALDERLEAAAGVSGPEFELLWRLRATPGRRLQMGEIAGLLLASRSGVTRLVDRLVEAGLLARETPPDNRRVAYARLTEQGGAVLARAQEAFGPAFEHAFARHLSDDDIVVLRQALRRLLEGNGAWAHDRCDPTVIEEDTTGRAGESAARAKAGAITR